MKWALRTSVAALSLVAPGQVLAQAAQQFDIVCAMEERWRETGGEAGSGTEQHLRYFSVDLAAMRFCGGRPCQRIRALPADNADAELNLSVPSDDPEGAPTEFRVNRLSGSATSYSRHVSRLDNSTLTIRGTGTCRREPFSGFPAAVF